ncbi:MAG: nucleoside-diphosphate kinase [Firmicutes bacterium]|jgi:nucleoside-diphosphate kinase|nr:nucleoside-diphosphate kinase [Bacillota bacterium]
MAVEQTFVIIKPEAVERRLVGEVLGRFERKGLEIKRLAVTQIQEQTAEEHYAHHKDKPFFPQLMEAITKGPVVLAVLEGHDAIQQVRTLVGATDPAKAAPGTIRGDLAIKLPYNMVHAADSPAAAEQEIKRFFGD